MAPRSRDVATPGCRGGAVGDRRARADVAQLQRRCPTAATLTNRKLRQRKGRWTAAAHPGLEPAAGWRWWRHTRGSVPVPEPPARVPARSTAPLRRGRVSTPTHAQDDNPARLITTLLAADPPRREVWSACLSVADAADLYRWVVASVGPLLGRAVSRQARFSRRVVVDQPGGVGGAGRLDGAASPDCLDLSLQRVQSRPGCDARPARRRLAYRAERKRMVHEVDSGRLATVTMLGECCLPPT